MGESFSSIEKLPNTETSPHKIEEIKLCYARYPMGTKKEAAQISVSIVSTKIDSGRNQIVVLDDSAISDIYAKIKINERGDIVNTTSIRSY